MKLIDYVFHFVWIVAVLTAIVLVTLKSLGILAISWWLCICPVLLPLCAVVLFLIILYVLIILEIHRNGKECTTDWDGEY